MPRPLKEKETMGDIEMLLQYPRSRVSPTFGVIFSGILGYEGKTHNRNHQNSLFTS